jgi:hypothetical protein
MIPGWRKELLLPLGHLYYGRYFFKEDNYGMNTKRLIYIFYKNIYNLTGNFVLRTLKNSFAIF